MTVRSRRGGGNDERRRLPAPPSFASGAVAGLRRTNGRKGAADGAAAGKTGTAPVSVWQVAVPSAALAVALLLLLFLAAGAVFAAGPRDEGWLDLGLAGSGAGRDTIAASCDEATSLRLTCERGSGKIRLIWIWNGPQRMQIGQNRRMAPGDVYVQPIKPQGVTSVQLFDEGDGVYRVELWREKRP